jgi:hypothetical protein
VLSVECRVLSVDDVGLRSGVERKVAELEGRVIGVCPFDEIAHANLGWIIALQKIFRV